MSGVQNMAEKITHRLKLMRAFQQYVSGQDDKSVILPYTEQEIRYALEKCAYGDRKEMWYHAMQTRLEELMPVKKEEKEQKMREIERFWNRVIIATVAVVAGVLGIILVRFGLQFGM